jgi:uncharacterized membrane protein YjgN (DUF898 family)
LGSMLSLVSHAKEGSQKKREPKRKGKHARTPLVVLMRRFVVGCFVLMLFVAVRRLVVRTRSRSPTALSSMPAGSKKQIAARLQRHELRGSVGSSNVVQSITSGGVSTTHVPPDVRDSSSILQGAWRARCAPTNKFACKHLS